MGNAINYKHVNKLFISMSSHTENFSQVIKCLEWGNAMQTEIQALGSNNTWTLILQPHGKTPIGSIWAYKIKHEVDGTI